MRNYDDYSKWTGVDWYEEKSQFDTPFGRDDSEEVWAKSCFAGETVSDTELDQAREIIRRAMSIPETGSIAEAADLIDRCSIKGEGVDPFESINPIAVLIGAEAEFNKGLGDYTDWELTHAVQEWNEPIGNFYMAEDLYEEEQRMARLVLFYAAGLIEAIVEDMAA